MGEQEIEGILVVDKEAGWTSADVVRKLRNILKIRRIGHTGTLDPLATGVLVVLLNRAARILRFLPEKEKGYIAQIYLGLSTDTFDAQGQIREKREVPQWGFAHIERVCKSFVGEIEQVPPPFSAVKIKGKKAYQLARAGKEVKLKPKRVRISEMEVLDWQPPVLKLRILCSRGTYIRSLAEEIGQKLGCGGHLLSLRRFRSGEFSIEQALTIAQISALYEKGMLRQKIIPIDYALRHLPTVKLPARELFSFEHGAKLSLSAISDAFGKAISPSSLLYQNPTPVRVKDESGCLRGIGRLDPFTKELHPLTIFA